MAQTMKARGEIINIGDRMMCPHLSILASIIRVALEDLRDGDAKNREEARGWLQRPEREAIVGLLVNTAKQHESIIQELSEGASQLEGAESA